VGPSRVYSLMGSPEPGLQPFMEGPPDLTFADRLEVSLLHQSVHRHWLRAQVRAGGTTLPY